MHSYERSYQGLNDNVETFRFSEVPVKVRTDPVTHRAQISVLQSKGSYFPATTLFLTKQGQRVSALA